MGTMCMNFVTSKDYLKQVENLALMKRLSQYQETNRTSFRIEMNKLETFTPRQRLLDVFYRMPWSHSSRYNLEALVALYARSNTPSEEDSAAVTSALATLVSEGVIKARPRNRHNWDEPRTYFLDSSSAEFENVVEPKFVSHGYNHFIDCLKVSPEVFRKMLIDYESNLFAYTDQVLVKAKGSQINNKNRIHIEEH